VCSSDLEEHLTGSHHTLEGFVVQGKLAFAAITARTLTRPPYLVTTTHTIPSGLPEQVGRRIVDAVQKAVTHLRYQTGPVDVDVVVEPDGAVQLIEIGARVGGSGLTELIRIAYGVDLVEASINAAIGLPVDLEPRHDRRFSLLTILNTTHDGQLAAVRGEKGVRRMSELAELRIVASVGQRVSGYRCAAAKLGYAVLVADSEQQLAEAHTKFARLLRFDITAPDDHDHEVHQ